MEIIKTFFVLKRFLNVFVFFLRNLLIGYECRLTGHCWICMKLLS